MKIGTRSLLFGVHQFAIHPWFVAWAWYKLYGFPFDLRLWMAFFIHDLGYWGKPNMDGPEGEKHPFWAASLMGRLFGIEWYIFCLYHSRFLAKQNEQPFSRLCVADKLSIALIPAWLYLLLASMSGELKEYMQGKGARTPANDRSPQKWFQDVQRYCKQWAITHIDGRHDTWTGTKRDLDLDVSELDSHVDKS